MQLTKGAVQMEQTEQLNSSASPESRLVRGSEDFQRRHLA
jgi:hypothetical protein